MIIVQIVEAPRNVQVMAIAAHPDDIESWCAGTLAIAIDNGCAVRLLLVTSGDKGSNERGADPRAVGMRREREATEAAGRIGISDVAFLRYPDGDVEDTRGLRSDLVRWIRRWQPEIVFTHDPENPFPPYLTHRDHRIVGRAALDAVYPLARDVLVFPEHTIDGLPAHAVREVWMFSSMVASSYVDISSGFDRKVHARLAHESQTSDPAALPDNWRTRAAQIGEPADVPLAETFTILRIG
jgi:LmbE family N-acetylglucosaminyl deacetylase